MKYDEKLFQSDKPLVFSEKENTIVKMLSEVSKITITHIKQIKHLILNCIKLYITTYNLYLNTTITLNNYIIL